MTDARRSWSSWRSANSEPAGCEPSSSLSNRPGDCLSRTSRCGQPLDGRRLARCPLSSPRIRISGSSPWMTSACGTPGLGSLPRSSPWRTSPTRSGTPSTPPSLRLDLATTGVEDVPEEDLRVGHHHGDRVHRVGSASRSSPMRLEEAAHRFNRLRLPATPISPGLFVTTSKTTRSLSRPRTCPIRRSGSPTS